MTSGLRERRIWAALACCTAVAGCSPSQGQAWPSQSTSWQGYYYENVLVNSEPSVSGNYYPSANACLAAMRDYTRNAPRSAGFACARGCPDPKDGYITDCREVAR